MIQNLIINNVSKSKFIKIHRWEEEHENKSKKKIFGLDLDINALSTS